MKLHLPFSFRKALLACLASLLLPSLSLSSAAAAPDSDFAFQWVWDSVTSTWQLEKADDATTAHLVFSDTANADGQRLTFNTVEFGEGYSYHELYWYWEQADRSRNSYDYSDPRWTLTDTPQSGASIRYFYDSQDGSAYDSVDDRIAIPSGSTHSDIQGSFSQLETKLDLTVPTGDRVMGGAISNEGTIGSIMGYFEGNSAFGYYLDNVDDRPTVKYYTLGGAIYNGGSAASITSIEGYFTGNNVSITQHGPTVSDSGHDNYYAFGGAIYNGMGASIGSISGTFEGNFAQVDRFSYVTGVHLNYAIGGAIYNGISDSSASLSSSIDSINGKFIGNYAFNKSNEHAAVGWHYALGGAIYNGILEVSNSNGNTTSSIGSISGDFVGNYASSTYETTGANTKDGLRIWLTTPLGSYALGGAIYNGIEDISSNSGALISSVGSIVGNFIGNYAYIFHKTQMQYDSRGDILLPMRDYAIGGAIFNGIIATSDNSGALSSSIDSITGSFIGNYAYNETPVTSQPGSAIGQGDKFTDQRHDAAGGAIFNGLIRISDSSAKVQTSIGDIYGSFVSNYAYTMSGYASAALVKSSNPENSDLGSGLWDQVSILANYAQGGAIYNGIEDVSGTGNGEFSSTINSIGGTFTGNYTFVKRTSAGSFYNDEVNIAQGGAIYNGINGISGTINSLTSNIDTINGDFIGNYAYVMSNSPNIPMYAEGGAISNAIDAISKADGSITSHIETITKSRFIGNYVNTQLERASTTQTNGSFGGAIANIIGRANESSGTIQASIGTISAEFTGNSAYARNRVAAVTNIYGGAIYNGIFEVTGNKADISTTIDSISGNFENNTAKLKAYAGGSFYSKGGAIYNGVGNVSGNTGQISSTIVAITNSLFTENHAYGKLSHGGAIYNGLTAPGRGTVHAIIGSISGNFTKNTAELTCGSASEAYGGAIANIYGEIGTIAVGSFSDNQADAGSIGSSNSSGGAIYNSFGEITSLTGNFINNAALGTSTSSGGAIMNGAGKSGAIDSQSSTLKSYIGSINGDFSNNSAAGSSSSTAFGGAIANGFAYLYNNSSSGITNNSNGVVLISIDEITSEKFSNNSAISASGTAIGGAIANGISKMEIITGTTFNNNKGDFQITLPDIDSYFIGNRAENPKQNTYGGAVYNGIATFSNVGTFNNTDGSLAVNIASLKGTFKDNAAISHFAATSTYYTYSTYGGAIFNGIASLTMGSNAFQNSGGTVNLTIGSISADFINNHAQGAPTLSAPINYNYTHAYGGAIFNGISSISNNSYNVTSKNEGVIRTNIDEIVASSFTNNSAESLAGKALGGAINNSIISISNSSSHLDLSQGSITASIGSIQGGDFTDNHAISTPETAAGGAIYNGIGTISNMTDTKGYIVSFKNGTIAASIGAIQANFTSNSAEGAGNASGGAISNDGGFIDNTGYYDLNRTFDNSNGKLVVSIASIKGNFSHNQALSTDGNANGGAIYNASASGTSKDLTTFNNNGGTIAATIGAIEGNFIENTASSTKGHAYGGAIFNSLGTFENTTINGGTIEASIESIQGIFVTNQAKSTEDEAKGGAVYNAGSIGKLGNDATSLDAYDASISGGIVNSSFIDNSATGTSSLGGAIYTSKDLLITQDKHSGHSYFTGNTANGERSSIYVGAPNIPVYMAVYNNSSLHIDDAISTNNGTLLILRGYADKSEAHGDRSGAIFLNHSVSQVGTLYPGKLLVDDVNLYLGYGEITRSWYDMDGDGNPIDGRLSAMENEDKKTIGADVDAGLKTYLDRSGITKTLTGIPSEDFKRADHLSAILSDDKVKFTVRSGTVHLTDFEAPQEAYTEYVIGNMIAYGVDYNYGDNEASVDPDIKKLYKDNNLFANFAFGINMNTDGIYYMKVPSEKSDDPNNTITRQMAQSDILTVFAKENANGSLDMDSTAKGRITLHSLSINALDRGWMFTKRPYGDINPDDPNRDPDNRGDEFNRDVYVQLINFVLLDAAGNVITDAGKLNDFYAQFDTKDNLLRLTDHFDRIDDVAAYVKSTQILASGIELATTKTKDDSIRITDYRDLLAEWAEHQGTWDGVAYNDDGSIKETANKNGMKKFELEGVYYLNRDINIKDNPTTADHSSTSAAMWGNDLEIFSTKAGGKIDLQGLNLLHLITAPQKVTLRNFSLVGVQNNTMENLGHLKLDSMNMESNLTVNNQGELTITGSTDIDYTITAVEKELDELGNLKTGSGDKKIATGKKMTIEHSTGTGVAQSVTRIFNTVEYQNIDHRGNKNDLQLAQTDGVWAIAGNWADAFDSVTYLNTTRDDGVTTTRAFDQFKMNELNMYGGAFALGAMHTNRLQLRNFTIQGGGVFVDSSTIDIAEGKEVMGGIDVISGGTAKYGSSASTGDTAYEPRAASANSGTGNGLIWLQSFTIQGSSEKNIIHVKFVDPGVADAVKDGMGVANGGKPSGAVNMEDGDHIWIWQITYNDEKAPQKGMYTLVRGDETNSGGSGGPSGPGIAPGNPTTPEVNDGAVSDLVGSYVSMMQVYNYAFEHADLYSASLYQARRQDFYSKHHTVVTPTKNGKGAESPEEETSCRPALARMGSGLWLQTYASTETMPLRNGPHVRNEMYGALLGTDSDLVEHRNGWVSVYSLYGGYLGSTQRYQSVRIRQNGGALGGTATFYKERFYTALTATIGTSSAAATGRYGHEDYDLFMGGIASRTGYNIELDDEGDYILQPTLLVSYSCFSASDYTNASGVKMDSRPVGTLQFHPYLKLISNKDCKWKPYATLGYVHDVMGKTKFRANGMHLPSMGIRPYVEYSIGTQYLWSDAYTIYGQIIGRNGGRNGMEVNLGLRWSW